jgi:hypothetical protein
MKKVKKFGRGGDVLTALGAGLAGYGAYKYFTRDKDKGKDDSSGASLKKPTISEEVEKTQDSSKATERKAEGDSSYSPKSKVGAKDIGFGGGADFDDKYVKPKGDKKKSKVAASTNQGSGESTPKPAIKEIAPSVSPAVKKAPSAHQNFLSSKAGLSGKGITTPGDSDKKEATSKAGIVFGGSTVRTPAQKMAEGAREVERRRQEEKKKKEGALKKGGMVKKYASGGSVSSASKRADGIAIRGKTRA